MMWFFLCCVLFSGTSSSISTSTAAAPATSSRPAHVLRALENNDNLYYFSVGSNLLREKLINRGLNGTKIAFTSFEPGRVMDHRLAFNMRGFLPLEPAMGGIEPCTGSECHGALVKLPATEYQKLWLSEGGGAPRPGYDEYLVEAVPYNHAQPVVAVALRAATHARLATDAAPSARYMDIIVRGAHELGLDSKYIRMLQEVPTAQVPLPLRLLATKNFHFVGLLFRLKLRFVLLGLSRLLWMVYYHPVPHGKRGAFMMGDKAIDASSGSAPTAVGRIASVGAHLRLLLSQLTMACILLPTAFLGVFVEIGLKITGTTTTPFFLRPANASTTATTASATNK